MVSLAAVLNPFGATRWLGWAWRSKTKQTAHMFSF